MKNTWLVILVIVVIIAGIFWLKSNSSYIPVSYGTTASPHATYNPSASPKVVNKSPAATATPVTASYTQLVKDYKDRIVQFNSSCQASPKSFVLKNDTSILLDNRSAQSHVVSVNGKSYTLGGYGYQIVSISSSTLPKTLTFNCDSSVNVGSILLQADISGQ